MTLLASPPGSSVAPGPPEHKPVRELGGCLVPGEALEPHRPCAGTAAGTGRTSDHGVAAFAQVEALDRREACDAGFGEALQPLQLATRLCVTLAQCFPGAETARS